MIKDLCIIIQNWIAHDSSGMFCGCVFRDSDFFFMVCEGVVYNSFGYIFPLDHIQLLFLFSYGLINVV